MSDLSRVVGVRRAGALAVFLMLAGEGSLLAQPAAPNSASSAQADTLFDQGRTLMDKKQYAEACAAFEASQKLAAAFSTQLNLAHCRELNDQFATAYGLYREVERQTRAPLDDMTQAMNHSASDHAKALAARLSKLTVTVPAGSRVKGLVVSRGGEVLDPGAWNLDLPVDGGAYAITAHAPGHVDWTSTIAVANEGDAKTVEVPALSVAAAPIAGPAAPSKLRAKLLPIAIASSGVVLFAGAFGIDAWARSEYNDSKVEPDDAKQLAEWHGANAKRYAADAVGAVGVAAIGVSVWLFFWPPHGLETRPGKVSVLPVTFANGGGLAAMGSF